jgi:hypothetical protein
MLLTLLANLCGSRWGRLLALVLLTGLGAGALALRAYARGWGRAEEALRHGRAVEQAVVLAQVVLAQRDLVGLSRQQRRERLRAWSVQE